jgi:hypothetical protein
VAAMSGGLVVLSVSYKICSNPLNAGKRDQGKALKIIEIIM